MTLSTLGATLFNTASRPTQLWSGKDTARACAHFAASTFITLASFSYMDPLFFIPLAGAIVTTRHHGARLNENRKNDLLRTPHIDDTGLQAIAASLEKELRKQGIHKHIRILPLNEKDSTVGVATYMGSGDVIHVFMPPDILKELDPRSICGLVAHEVSHDVKQAVFFDTALQINRSMTFYAGVGAAITFMLSGGLSVAAGGTIIAAQLLQQVIQTHYARGEEYRCDRGAVTLTGDAAGLGRALAHYNRFNQSTCSRRLQRCGGVGRLNKIRSPRDALRYLGYVADHMLHAEHPHSFHRVRRLRSIANAQRATIT